jgi:hypothetical protein
VLAEGSPRLWVSTLLLAAVLLATVGVATAGAEKPGTSSRATGGFESDIYSDPDAWLCRPDTDDVCDEDLAASVVRADGTIREQPFRPAKRPAVDCFYAYPTVSGDPTSASDLVPDPDLEGATARNQVARLASACRVFAPMYPQLTIAALRALLRTGPPTVDDAPPQQVSDNAYSFLRDAWREYLANDNDGRGVVLVGHSQGSALLEKLLREEIEPRASIHERLVSALLIGWAIAVPDGEVVGGAFERTPLCRADRQVGCVVSYSTFRSDAPPPAGSPFGRVATEGQHAACTNPAALDGGAAVLSPYFERAGVNQTFFRLLGLSAASTTWSTVAQPSAPWVTLPGLVEAQCVEQDGASFLAVTVRADPNDPRVDDVPGEVPLGFGLHVVDVNLAMGDLESLVQRQAKAYAAR